MRKSLVKYIIASEKKNSTFEPRLAELLSCNMDSENAMECLVYGIPVEVKKVDKDALKTRISRRFSNPSLYKIEDIFEVSITDDKYIKVEYKYSQKKFFTSEEAAQNAVEKHLRYEGSSCRNEKYNVGAWIPELTESVNFSVSDVENCIEVVRE